MTSSGIPSQYGLDPHGIENVNVVYWNLSTPLPYEEALRRHEGRLAHLGPLVVRTGQYTGRSPRDKFIVREPSSESQVWWGDVNHPLGPEQFHSLRGRLLAYLQDRDVFAQDCFVGAEPQYRVPIRVVTETAWHNLFARNMFIQPAADELTQLVPQFSKGVFQVNVSAHIEARNSGRPST